MNKIYYAAIILLSITSGPSMAQLTPVALTAASFNEDIIANGAGSNPQAVTTTGVEGLNENILYSQDFRNANSGIITGGGLPDNGILVKGQDTWQLQDYGGNNALYLAPGITGVTKELVLLNPAAYSQITLAAFAANGGTGISVSLRYTDNSYDLFTDFLGDWFGGKTYIINALGRIQRLVTVESPSGLPDNPKIFALPLTVNPTKTLQSIYIANMANNNNTINNTAVVVLAASGVLVSTLPINLASFKGRYENNLKCVQLNWDAYNTAGTVKFEIERSPDGNRFNKVDEVKPSSANEKASYSFNDYTANSSQTNFYRVKQIQQAGQPIYTAVIRVEGTKASLVTLKLMQSANAVEIHNIPLQRVYEYTLMNSASSVVKKGKVSSGDNSILINSLSKGVYYLKLASGNEIQTLKFLR